MLEADHSPNSAGVCTRQFYPVAAVAAMPVLQHP